MTNEAPTQPKPSAQASKPRHWMSRRTAFRGILMVGTVALLVGTITLVLGGLACSRW